MVRLVRVGAGGVWGVVCLLVLTTVLIDSGLVWRALARADEFYRGALARGGNVSMLVVPRNLAAAQRPRGQPGPSAVFVGSSTTCAAVSRDAVSTALGQAGLAADVRLLWMPSVDAVGIHILTQHALRESPDIVLLGLSPAITQTIVGEGNAAASQYAWYQDWRIVAPALERYGWQAYQDPRRPLERFAGRWSVYRCREVLLHHAVMGLRRFTSPPAPYADALPLANMWLAGDVNLRAFRAARRRYESTRDPADYMAAYAHFPQGRESIIFWHDAFERAVWRPPSAQWAALAAWVDLVRTRGAVPAIVVLPYNAFFSRPGSAALFSDAPADQPYINPERYALWREDVRAFCDAHGVQYWDDFERYPPERFYDLHHLMPDIRRDFATLLAARLQERTRR